ncbi:unnamed protein product [Peniophora sp. CBMAI 1063]|nr:unnamed protein product [Peniophora sp. CBMAI 1063]
MRAMSPRDALLVILGAGGMYLVNVFVPFSEPVALVEEPLASKSDLGMPEEVFVPPAPAAVDVVVPAPQAPRPILEEPLIEPPKPRPPLAPTVMHQHAPGWTIFDNLYMANGTLFAVTDTPDDFPAIEWMTSTGLPAVNSPESIQERMPTAQDFSFITTAEAKRRWGNDADETQARVFNIDGNTLLFNDPDQFLNHYYHFCAELMFGAWAFWTGTFPDDTPSVWARAMFPHTGWSWRDNPGMNALFARGGFPTLHIEVDSDWKDRVAATAVTEEQLAVPEKNRAWRFDRVLLADRSAAFRGPECGSRTQRTAAEAMLGVVPKDRDGKPVPGHEFLERGWWEPVRRRVLNFVGVPKAQLDLFKLDESERVLPNEKIVVTYVDRQSVRRHLIHEDHELLVQSLRDLCARRGWELIIMKGEALSKDEQLQIASKTTYLVGVHGNGLSHLIMMPPTPAATVIEIFFPTGYAHDYEWTARSLGMKHFAVWNDTSTTFPEVQWPSYPDGFQGESIPVYGPYVAELIEGRADGKL